MSIHNQIRQSYSVAIRQENLSAKADAWHALKDDCARRAVSPDLIVSLNAGGYCVLGNTIPYIVSCVEGGVEAERILGVLDEGYSSARRIEGFKALLGVGL